MTEANPPHFLQLPTTRASVERKTRLSLSEGEYRRFHEMIPDLGLDGAPFDEASWAHPLVIPACPRVTVLEDDPRRVAVSLQDGRGRFIGVTGDAAFEQACLGHPGAFLFAVGNVTERQKGDKVYLNMRPRGWVVVEEVAPEPAEERARGRSRSRKR